MSLPSLAIVVVSYNSGKWLEKCLSTLLVNIEDYPCPVETAVVENHFQAETYPLVKQFEGRGIKYLLAPSNLGYGGAANFGWEQLAGEICIILNPDMSFPPGWLRKFTAPFTRDPAVGISGCKLLYPDGKIQHAGGIVKRGAALVETIGQGEPDDGRWDGGSEAEFVTGAALGVRRAIIEKLDGFDPAFYPGYYEDVDLCYRAARAGWKIWYEGRAAAVHYEGASFGRASGYFRSFHRNRLRFVLKHYPAGRLFEEFLAAERRRLQGTTEGADRQAAGEVYTATRRFFNQPQPAASKGPGGKMNPPYNPQWEEKDPAVQKLLEHLAEVKQGWLVEEKAFSSRLPFIAALREKFNSISTRWYVQPILAQQVEYNAAVARAIEDLGNLISGELAAGNLESSVLASRLIALEERLDRIEALLEKLLNPGQAKPESEKSS